MPRGSWCFGSHATRIASNGSEAAENHGHVLGTVKHSHHECIIVEVARRSSEIPCANPYRASQV